LAVNFFAECFAKRFFSAPSSAISIQSDLELARMRFGSGLAVLIFGIRRKDQGAAPLEFGPHVGDPRTIETSPSWSFSTGSTARASTARSIWSTGLFVASPAVSTHTKRIDDIAGVRAWLRGRAQSCSSVPRPDCDLVQQRIPYGKFSTMRLVGIDLERGLRKSRSDGFPPFAQAFPSGDATRK